MTTTVSYLADIVLNIEAELRRLQLWSTKKPEAQALQSIMPFASDTLEFEQWLQWVFLPRIYASIEAGEDLPQQSDIKPYAEQAFEINGIYAEKLLLLIEQFDSYVNGKIH